jgi:hypothetical protein
METKKFPMQQKPLGWKRILLVVAISWLSLSSKRATVLPEEIPESLREKCREAARLCPNNAILIKE